MDTNVKIVVGTSIAPFDIEKQRVAIDSWIKIGIEVVSFNTEDEYIKLKAFFSDIEFVIVDRDGSEFYGKPYVYFNDIMSYFKNGDDCVYGIINSDIHFVGVNNKFLEFIRTEAMNALVYGQRMDIKSLDNLEGKMYIGHDYFFFSKEIAGIYPEEPFFIGQAAWDYWIVFYASYTGYKVKRLINPLAYHIMHDQKWTNETDNKLKKQVIMKYIMPKLLETKEEVSYQEAYTKFSWYVKVNSEDIVYFENKQIEKVLIVYSGDTKTETYESIVNQSYEHYRIEYGTIENFQIDEAKEKYVFFVEDGEILHERYIETMVNSIGEKDYIFCEVTLYGQDNSRLRKIYPMTVLENQENFSVPKACNFYNLESLKKIKIGKLDVTRWGVGQSLVYLNYSNYVKYILRGKNLLTKNENIKFYDPNAFYGRLILFPAGGGTINWLSLSDKANDNFEVVGIIDNDLNKIGKTIRDIKIYNPQEIEKISYDNILITSSQYGIELYEQIIKIIDDNKKILFWLE